MTTLSKPDRPCDACRRRKIRCLVESGGDCALCRSHGQSCTFIEGPPKKKRKQSDVVSPVGVVGVSPEARSHQESPHDYSAYPEAPSLLRQTLGHQHFRTNIYIGATSGPSRVLLDLTERSPHGQYHAGPLDSEVRRVGNDGYFLILPDEQAVIDEQLETLDKIEALIRPHGPALVDLFFRIVHPSFPILHKDVFLEKHGRSYRELAPACLSAVYMLALNWWSYSIELAHLTKPNIGELEKLVPALMVYNKISKVSDIQAGLLLLQRPKRDSWRLTAQLVAMAEDVGLHRDCTDWQIPDWEKGARKRTAWALFIQDKWGALVHGRPSHIKADNWEVLPLDLSDFPENIEDEDAEQGSSEVEKGILIFMHLASLTQILSEIIDDLFTLKAAKNQRSTFDLLQAVKPLQLQLKSWYSQLPSCLAFDSTQPRKLSATGHLYLAYLTAEATLHRAILESEMRDALELSLRKITRDAAIMRFKSVIDFLKRLKPEHMQGFWHSASEPCLAIISTFALVLLATSRDPSETKDIFSQIAEFRWLLNINGPSADFMKHAVDLLQANASFLSSYRPRKDVKGINGTSPESEETTPHSVGRGRLAHQSGAGGNEGGTAYTPAIDALQDSGRHHQLSPSLLGAGLDQYWFYDINDFGQPT
ncbi:hypothetical protein PV11_08434 [Exophiala sideris]|uniref:Zn(2)-C6 fungal-type domain-containing protein n=1 Tax=Exophiala sideris TaxID=1016849 RepID=A0A0D1YJ07_9EURO|nr:hypothetical protein PV11_08434 [Exophiala sideris]